MKQSSIKNFLYRTLCGFLFGVSVIVPGVSGSVMAVIMGIYTDLITIVANPFKNFKKNVLYCLPIGIGAVIGVGLFILILDWLFGNFKLPAYMLFIGLIAGSVPAVVKEAGKGGFKLKYLLGTAFAFAFAISIGLLEKSGVSLSFGMPQNIYYPISGAIAGITSMMPGMSVSMVLMVLGVYEPMLSATKNLEILTMAPVGICFVAGMFLFSKLTKFIFEKYRGFGYTTVAGFMCGSLITIILTQLEAPKDIMSAVLAAAAVASGFYISLIFQRLGKKFNLES